MYVLDIFTSRLVNYRSVCSTKKIQFGFLKVIIPKQSPNMLNISYEDWHAYPTFKKINIHFME